MSRFVVRQESLALQRWPPLLHRLRAMHISDLHLRGWNRLLEQVRSVLLDPSNELLLLTGDYCVEPKDWRRAARVLQRLLDDVRPALGAFAILGNHDGQSIIPALADMGVRVLRNEVVAVGRGCDTVNIAGIEQVEVESGDVASALAGADPRTATILLAHYPSTIHHVPPGCVDLMLAGHTHAGQVRLPLWGCAWAHDHVSTEHAWGLHHINGTYLHVSAGVGASGPLVFRLNCPPEITRLLLLSTAVTCPAQTLREAASEPVPLPPHRGGN